MAEGLGLAVSSSVKLGSYKGWRMGSWAQKLKTQRSFAAWCLGAQKSESSSLPDAVTTSSAGGGVTHL